MADFNPIMSIIDKKRSDSVLSTETQVKYKDTERLKVMIWRKIYHANTNKIKLEYYIIFR